MAACPHGEDTSYCVECMDGPPPERPAPTIVRRGTFRAKYEGHCRACRDSWAPGDRITQLDLVERHGTGTGTRIIDTHYVHEDCDPAR